MKSVQKLSDYIEPIHLCWAGGGYTKWTHKTQLTYKFISCIDLVAQELL